MYMLKRRSGLHNDKRAFCYNDSKPIIPEIPEIIIITIQNSPTYTENIQMEFLRYVTIINGNFTINMSNPDLTVFDNLRIINGTITLINIINISGFNKLQSCVYLGILDCNSISGFINLTTISDSLEINSKLENIDGFTNITTIGGNLNIRNNNLLTTITGFTNITTIGGNLNIRNNNLLTTITGFTNIKTIGGNLNIRNNILLTTIPEFTNITTISGNLDIIENYNLTTITGFTNITTIGNYSSGGNTLYIIRNNILTITGFTNITTIFADISIYNNNNDSNTIQMCKTRYDAIVAAQDYNYYIDISCIINDNC